MATPIGLFLETWRRSLRWQVKPSLNPSTYSPMTLRRVSYPSSIKLWPIMVCLQQLSYLWFELTKKEKKKRILSNLDFQFAIHSILAHLNSGMNFNFSERKNLDRVIYLLYIMFKKKFNSHTFYFIFIFIIGDTTQIVLFFETRNKCNPLMYLNLIEKTIIINSVNSGWNWSFGLYEVSLYIFFPSL